MICDWSTTLVCMNDAKYTYYKVYNIPHVASAAGAPASLRWLGPIQLPLNVLSARVQHWSVFHICPKCPSWMNEFANDCENQLMFNECSVDLGRAAIDVQWMLWWLNGMRSPDDMWWANGTWSGDDVWWANGMRWVNGIWWVDVMWSVDDVCRVNGMWYEYDMNMI